MLHVHRPREQSGGYAAPAGNHDDDGDRPAPCGDPAADRIGAGHYHPPGKTPGQEPAGPEDRGNHRV